MKPDYEEAPDSKMNILDRKIESLFVILKWRNQYRKYKKDISIDIDRSQERYSKINWKKRLKESEKENIL